jgi:hypothetical protein
MQIDNVSQAAMESIRRYRYWVAANILGIATYLYLASFVWAPMGNGPSASQEGFQIGLSWSVRTIPVLVLFGIADLVWLKSVLLRLFRRSDWFSFALFLSTAALWYGAFILDFTRH